MKVAILDYGTGNVGSLGNMLTRKCGCACSVEAAGSPGLEGATHWILPGVGHFGYAASKLRECGLDELVRSFLDSGGRLLGICLGAQLLLEYSEEGEAHGLGLIPGTVERFKQKDLRDGERIPHMGWADVKVNDALLLERMRPSSRFYFVHSYRMKPEKQTHELMRADFSGGFSAAVRKDNVTGVQFHPEKSHQFGIQFLQAWLEGA